MSLGVGGVASSEDVSCLQYIHCMHMSIQYANWHGHRETGSETECIVAIKIRFSCTRHIECKFGVNIRHSQPDKLTLLL